MKAIVVIDMPDGVSLDEWYAVKVVVDRLKATEEELMQGIPFDESKTFKFVPLRPLPKKMEVKVEKIEDIMHTEFQTIDVITDKFIADVRFETDKLIALGYNACLDEILGETE